MGYPEITRDQREMAVVLLANALRRDAHLRARVEHFGADAAPLRTGQIKRRAEPSQRYVDGMRDILRVLKPGGRALFQIPLHLRDEGPAFAARLREVGFSVEVDRYAERLPDDVVERHRLLRGEDVYLCTKPPPAGLTQRSAPGA